jgi:hypothetical protein
MQHGVIADAVLLARDGRMQHLRGCWRGGSMLAGRARVLPGFGREWRRLHKKIARNSTLKVLQNVAYTVAVPRWWSMHGTGKLTQMMALFIWGQKACSMHSRGWHP